MGDYFQTVVDRDATEEEAPILGKGIHEWLVGEGIVCADQPTAFSADRRLVTLRARIISWL